MGVLPVDDPCPWPVSSDAPSSLWQKSTDAPKEHRLKPVPPCVIKRLRSTVARTSVCVGFLPKAARCACRQFPQKTDSSKSSDDQSRAGDRDSVLEKRDGEVLPAVRSYQTDP